MTNIQNLIFNKVKRMIKLTTGISIYDIDTFASSINWEPNDDCFNGDVFKGTIYFKNDDRGCYTFTGILKSFNEFDVKKLTYIEMQAVVKQDLI